MMIVILLAIVCAIFIIIFSFIGAVRFARTGKISEAFNFSAILAQIRRIGWINYIVALLIIFVIGFIFGMIFNVLVIGNVIGFAVMFVICVPFIVFTGRYTALVYAYGEENVPVAPESKARVVQIQ